MPNPVTAADPAADVFLTANQLRQRWGSVSHMFLLRRMAEGFPQPLYMGKLRFWRLSAVTAWEAAQLANPRPKPTPGKTKAQPAKSKKPKRRAA